MSPPKKKKAEQVSASSTRERIKALFGDDVIMEAEDSVDAYIKDGLSTGSLTLDMVIGRPGIPFGRLTEIAGEDDSGKTALGLELVYQAQKRGILCVVEDTEKTYDDARLSERGIDKSGLLFLRTSFLEETFERVEKIVDTLLPDEEALIMIDSIAGGTTKAEFESDYDEHTVGSHARALAKGFRKIIPKIAQKKVALVVVNQLKENLNISLYTPKRSRLKHFGGYAVKYHATLRVLVEKKGIVVEDENKPKKDQRPIGLNICFYTLKNKVAPPYREAEFVLNFARGINPYDDLFNAGLALDLITSKGGFYYYKNGKGFRKKDWPKFIMNFGGSSKLYDELLKEAYKQGIMKPYGIVEAPSNGEKAG